MICFDDNSLTEGEENGDSGQIKIDTDKSNSSRDLSYSVTEINGLSLFSDEYREDESVTQLNKDMEEKSFSNHIFNDLILTDENYEDIQAMIFLGNDSKNHYNREFESNDYMFNALILIFMFIIFGVFLMFHFIKRILRNDNNDADKEQTEGF